MARSPKSASIARPVRELFLPENRSRLMSLIKGRGNKTTEEKLAGGLRLARISGWRRHAALPGRPDFTFPQQKLCVFVHGCFWHGCPRCYKAPARNKAFWRKKVSGNRRRDLRVARALRAKGYKVLTIWECQLRGKACTASIKRVASALQARRLANGSTPPDGEGASSRVAPQ